MPGMPGMPDMPDMPDIPLANLSTAQPATAHSGWQLSLITPGDASPLLLTAQAVVVAVPAPQALALLDPQVEQGQSEQKNLAPELAELVQAIRRVEFDPCISVIATYPAEQLELAQQPWRAITFPPSSGLAWLSLESTKRPNPQPLVVGQSTAAFARQYLDLEVADLKPIGQSLLNQATAWIPWLSAPTELQVHRWRYGLVSQPLKALYLATSQPHPLVCCGDWCGGRQVENALESGLAAACQISHRLNHHPLSTSSWQTHALELMHQLTAALA
jgi:renalase